MDKLQNSRGYALCRGNIVIPLRQQFLDGRMQITCSIDDGERFIYRQHCASKGASHRITPIIYDPEKDRVVNVDLELDVSALINAVSEFGADNVICRWKVRPANVDAHKKEGSVRM